MSKLIQCGGSPKHTLRALAKRKNGKIHLWSAWCKGCKRTTVLLSKHGVLELGETSLKLKGENNVN